MITRVFAFKSMISALSFLILACTGSRSELAGTWRYESASGVGYTEIVLVLKADGTYTKHLKFRTPAMYSGAVGSGPTGGGEHSGTWTATGTVVSLSGDGNWPASTHDLSEFHRVQ
jgi:hypothetical protein